MRLHLSADLRYPRLHFPVHHLWFSLPISSGAPLRLLLLGHRRLLLLPPVLPGGQETGASLPTGESCPVVSQGGQSQVQPPLLHPLPQDHSFPPQLVRLSD